MTFFQNIVIFLKDLDGIFNRIILKMIFAQVKRSVKQKKELTDFQNFLIKILFACKIIIQSQKWLQDEYLKLLVYRMTLLLQVIIFSLKILTLQLHSVQFSFPVTILVTILVFRGVVCWSRCWTSCNLLWTGLNRLNRFLNDTMKNQLW